MRQLNREVPRIGAEHYKTYQVVSPRATHYRPATCTEVDCGPHVNGWKTILDEATQQGLAHYIRKDSGRKFTEERTEAGLTVFTFEPGQMCFAAAGHQVPLERDPIYRVKGGDWRGNPRGITARVHKRAGDWVDDFATHQMGIAEQIQKG